MTDAEGLEPPRGTIRRLVKARRRYRLRIMSGIDSLCRTAGAPLQRVRDYLLVALRGCNTLDCGNTLKLLLPCGYNAKDDVFGLKWAIRRDSPRWEPLRDYQGVGQRDTRSNDGLRDSPTDAKAVGTRPGRSCVLQLIGSLHFLPFLCALLITYTISDCVECCAVYINVNPLSTS